MSYDLKRAGIRAKLKARAEPYWSTSEGKGKALGYRQRTTTPEPQGSWIARWTEPAALATSSRPKYVSKALGWSNDMEYEQALIAARQFFADSQRAWDNRGRAVPLKEIVTVEDAVRWHIAHLRIKKGDEAADSAASKMLFVIEGTPFGRTHIDRLEAIHVQDWLNGLVADGKRGKVTANRIFRQFKAAMNYLKKMDRVQTDNPWKNVDEFPVQSGRRTARVDRVQYDALVAACFRRKDAREIQADPDLKHCHSGLGRLIQGGMITGARPRELMLARCKNFDARDNTLVLVSNKNRHGKAKPREFYLDAPADIEFFKSLIAGKQLDDYLFTLDDGTSWVYTEGEMEGRLKNRYQCEGMRAAVRAANKALPEKNQIPIPVNKNERVTFYTLRHTAITELLDSGAEINAVAESVGNSPAMIKLHYDQNRKQRNRKELAKRNQPAQEDKKVA